LLRRLDGKTILIFLTEKEEKVGIDDGMKRSTFFLDEFRE